MKKIIFAAGLIILFGVMVSGCASKQTQEQDAGQGDTVTGVPTVQETDIQDGQKNNSAGSNVSSLTRAELDKLKADLENFEADDVGGLSGD